MLPVDKDSNMVYFSEWIKDFTCYESIIEKLNRNQIKFDLLPFTNDYWVRDFMPIQISETEFIEYKYNPDYLQNKPSYITNPAKCCRHLNISTNKIDVVLDVGNIIKTGSIGGFIYLEVLDASFSFDGVIGAFAITKDIIIIMVGLGVGALFVRSITIYLVEKETLNEYVFLEHGAHYAIGILAFIMLLNIKFHIPEAITGLIGIVFILLSLYSSIKYNRR